MRSDRALCLAALMPADGPTHARTHLHKSAAGLLRRSVSVVPIYPNGISTALPESVQQQFVRSVEGLEQAKIVKAGYAVEYDYVDPRALCPSLETRGRQTPHRKKPRTRTHPRRLRLQENRSPAKVSC